MDFSAAHTGFVAGAYGLSAIILIGLVIQIMVRDRRLKAELRRIEEQRRQ